MTRIRRRVGGESGFTVPELLVTMALFSILSVAFTLVIGSTITHSAVITNESLIQTQTRVALNQVVKDLREATLSSSTDTSPFVTSGGVMSPTTVTFYAPDGSYATGSPTSYHLREISYRLFAGNLQRASAVSSNTSGPPWTLPALDNWVTLLSGVTNTNVFVYYGGSQPPVATSTPAAVRTVVVTLSESVRGTTVTYTYSSSATLRETPPS